jgi:hypothetical protein
MVFAFNISAIQGGHYNCTTKIIEINIQYGGGCAAHKFQLQVDACCESYPVQCDAKLIDLTTNDSCEALLFHRVSFNLHDIGLENSYYTGASTEIQGADNSKVLIKLP